MAPGYLKEREKSSYPFSASGESNLPEYFCRGNVFQIMTLLDAIKSTSMEDFVNDLNEVYCEPKSASSENSSYAKKSLLIVQLQHQKLEFA